MTIIFGWKYSHHKWQNFNRLDNLTSFYTALSMPPKIPKKLAILSRYRSRLIVRSIAIKSPKFRTFCRFFCRKVLIRNDSDKISIFYWRYNRQYFEKSRFIAQTLAILKTWVYIDIHIHIKKIFYFTYIIIYEENNV